MDNWFQILLPIATLLLGYFLNIWVGSIESTREIQRRRIMEREKAYAEIIAKLHELFKDYRHYLVQTRNQLLDSSPFNRQLHDLLFEKDAELVRLIHKHSLYLKPSILEALRNVYVTSAGEVDEDALSRPDEEKIKEMDFWDDHAEETWAKAKVIISEMRHELGLEEYPENILNLWPGE